MEEPGAWVLMDVCVLNVLGSLHRQRHGPSRCERAPDERALLGARRCPTGAGRRPVRAICKEVKTCL
jgi:hypothetical protein